MTDLRYAVVIPTIGRSRLAELVTAVDGDPAPSCIVIATIGVMPPLRSIFHRRWRR